MRYRDWRARVLGAAAVPLLAAAAAAAQGPRSLELTPFVGYNLAGDLYTTSGADAAVSNSFLWGARLSFHPNAKLGVALSYTRIRSDVRLDNVQGEQPHDDFGRMAIALYDLTFLSYFTPLRPKFRPFASITLGLSHLQPHINTEFVTLSGSRPNARTLLTYALGLGATAMTWGRAQLRLEGRWRGINTHMRGPDPLWCDPWGFCYVYPSAWYRSGELAVGVSLPLR